MKQVMCGVSILVLNLPTAEFKLFDNVADLFKSVSIALLFALIVGDHLHLQSSMKNQHITYFHY